MSGAGDVNGDGFDDIIVGASEADPDGESSAGGKLRGVRCLGGFGAGTRPFRAEWASTGFRLDGIDAVDRSGSSVKGAGDVNGDGFATSSSGRSAPIRTARPTPAKSYVVFGASGGLRRGADLSALDGSNGFRIDGINADDQSGFSVSGAGDVNGDGFDDIIVGARLADPDGRTLAGESYVVFGASGALARLSSCRA